MMQSNDRPRSTSLTHPREVTVWEPAQGDHLWVFPKSKDEVGSGGEFHIYLDHRLDPVAAASFARFSLGVGGDLAEHRHDRSEEMAFLISGEGVVKRRQEGELVGIPVRPGCVWYIPPGAWHTIGNTGDEPMTLVFVVVPNTADGLLSFFRRIATIPGTEAQPLDREELARIGAEHDFILRTAPDGGR